MDAKCPVGDSYSDSSGATDYLVTLFLVADGKLIIHHEYWDPSENQEAKFDEYFGTWHCNQGKVVLN